MIHDRNDPENEEINQGNENRFYVKKKDLDQEYPDDKNKERPKSENDKTRQGVAGDDEERYKGNSTWFKGKKRRNSFGKNETNDTRK